MNWRSPSGSHDKQTLQEFESQNVAQHVVPSSVCNSKLTHTASWPLLSLQLTCHHAVSLAALHVRSGTGRWCHACVRAEHAIGSHCHALLNIKGDGLDILHSGRLTSCTHDGFRLRRLLYARVDVAYASNDLFCWKCSLIIIKIVIVCTPTGTVPSASIEKLSSLKSEMMTRCLLTERQ